MNKSGSKLGPILNAQLQKLAKRAQCEDYCYKGNQIHYTRLQDKASHKLKPTSNIYCIDKAAIDVALQMSVRRSKMITYLTDCAYESVLIKSRAADLQQSQSVISKEQFQKYFEKKQDVAETVHTKIPQSVSAMALYILKTQRFVVQASSLDIHPYESYKKMCGYLMAKTDGKITKYFKQTRFSAAILSDNVSTAAILNELREKYLYTDYYKLKHLPRRNPNQEIDEKTRQEWLLRWKKSVDFELIGKTTVESFDEVLKFRWAVDNGLGSVATFEQILNDKYRKYYYGSWI